jgi:hypothetical protein
MERLTRCRVSRARIALHYGPCRPTGGRQPAHDHRRRSAILCAARSSRWSSPADLATEDFRQQFLERRRCGGRRRQAPDGGDRFNIRKPGSSEPDT